MEAYQQVYEKLAQLNITPQIVEHPPVFTTEEADKYLTGIDCANTKSLFLTNKKKRDFYLLIMNDEKRVDLKRLGETIGATGLRFASEALLLEKLDLTPGSVTIFGLLNNSQRDVKLFFDQSLFEKETISFHPNDNTKTIIIGVEEMLAFVQSLEWEYQVLSL